MIQQRAEKLVALIQRQKDLRSHIDRLDGFRTQAEVIRNAAEKLGPILVRWHLLAKRGILGAVPPPEAARLLGELKQLRARITDDPAFILGPHRLAVLRNEVPSLAARLEQLLFEAWRAHVIVRTPAVNQEVLTVLLGIGALRSQVARVSAGIREISDRAGRLPTTENEIDQLDSKAADVIAAWEDLDSGQLPSDVLSFLKEAGSSTGADLNKLTDSVRYWLVERELTAAFRVRQVTT